MLHSNALHTDVDWREYYMSLADGFDENSQTASDAGI
jgi:hypothetical protein